MSSNELKTKPRVPLDLLETFVCLAVHEGDASAASKELDISQPTMSKRLSALRQFSSESKADPWFQLQGKRWHLTDEGQRVFPVVSGLVRQYRETESFLTATAVNHKPLISVACGQTSSQGMVSGVAQRFLAQQPDIRIRIATPRSKSRIEGVAAGLYDMAVVTESPENIFQIAGKELQITDLYQQEWVLYASPSKKSPWGGQWNKLPSRRPILAEELIPFPFILPEPDASNRKLIDNWFAKSTGLVPEVVVETGGWQSILGFAKAGHGVCVIPSQVLSSSQRKESRKIGHGIEPRVIKVIAKKARKENEPALQGVKLSFYELLLELRD